jgi:hypothetical protein
MYKSKKTLISLLLIIIAGIIIPFSSTLARTVSTNDTLPLDTSALEGMGAQEAAFREQAGYNTSATVGGIAARIIQAVLSLLGIIFLVLMVYAGYLWMTAQGNESQVEKAKDIIKAAIIGLIIVAAAYSITYFIFNALGEATGSGGGNRPL